MTVNKRDIKRDIAAARWLLERHSDWLRILNKYENVPIPETLDFLESIARRGAEVGKSGRPPMWHEPALNAFIYEMVEVVKERGSSTRKAWKQVSGFFKTLGKRSGLHRGYSIDQIKRAYYKGLALGPDVRSQYRLPGDHSSFKAFLDKLEAEPARPKSGAETNRV